MYKESLLKLKPYLRLIRFNNPTGTILLLLPCLWSIILASGEYIDLLLVAKFVLGSFLMRSAGCIINDITDRNVDKEVARTKYRPLASGMISIKNAIIALALLLFGALIILLTTNKQTITIGMLSIIPIMLYPLMKRITYWPQIFLGFTFNLGVLMASSATTGAVKLNAILLYLGCVCWTIGYDSIYAFQDIEDDKRIGIKSSAIKMASNPQRWIGYFYKGAAICILGASTISGANVYFYPLALLAFSQLYWQVTTLNINKEDCFNKFKSNILFGVLMLIAIIIAKI